MKVNDHRQTLLANNMANAHTAGFKQDLAVAMQRVVESREDAGAATMVHPILDGLSGGVNVRPAYTSWDQGPIEWTGKPLDVAIDGEGVLAVSDGESTRYTRNGSLAINTEGELALATESGRWRVLDDSGAPIKFDPAGGEIEISGSGVVRQGEVVVGQMRLASVGNPRLLRKVGENLFELTGGEMEPAKGQIVSGSLEGSNFDVMRGLAAMIATSRAYQMNATLLDLQDRLTGQAVSTLGRVA
jgi:flagellar basal body rod protein FlgG